MEMSTQESGRMARRMERAHSHMRQEMSTMVNGAKKQTRIQRWRTIVKEALCSLWVYHHD